MPRAWTENLAVRNEAFVEKVQTLPGARAANMVFWDDS